MKNTPLVSFLCILTLLFSCRKDKDFLNSPSARLSFSTDSIAFDTVFTTIGTTTRNFRVYNPHKESVLIEEISLKNGQQSVFRINVDGIASTRVQNVELLSGDSLYVFVEATIDPRDQDNPFFVEDEIEFVINGNLQKIKLLAYGQDAYYIIADTKIGGLPPFKIAVGEGIDTTWTSKRPVVVYGYAVVDSTATLRITEGTKIYFHQNAGLWVYRGGTIKVNGTLNNPVIFQGDRLETAYEDVPGQWDRIWINDGSLGNEFNYAIIKNAFIGMQAEVFPFDDPVSPITAGLQIKNTIIQNCSAFGMYSAFFDMNAENLLITNCGQYNMAILGGGEYNFKHSTLANYFSAESRENPLLYIQNSIVNALGKKLIGIPKVNFYNSIIVGANDEEFDYELDELEPNGEIDFLFSHSILKTEKNTSDTTRYKNVTKNPSGQIFEDMDAQDFHLAPNSPAINIGNLNVANTVPLDLDGKSRTVDAQPDAGVYEFN